MLPLRDNVPARTTPVVNYAIIGVTGFVFLLQLGEEPGGPTLAERFGMIPARITHPDQPVKIVRAVRQVRLPDGRIGLEKVVAEAAPSPVPPILTAVTCIFLHGGWLHFLGNMWFLFVFGDNVEDRFGHFGYLLLYVGFGAAASVSHYATDPNSTIPTIGASASIAGVMGAYMVLYPRAQVLTLVPIFVVIQLMVLPAPLFLGIWYLIQLVQGATAITAEPTTGVAWWAHIGGFVAGFLVAKLAGQGHLLKPPVETIRPGMDHAGRYRRLEPPGRRIEGDERR